MTAPNTVATDRLDSPRVLLPPYRLVLRSVRAGSFDAPGGPTWLGSEWREDRSELLGGERSVCSWLRAVHAKSEAQSREWARLYWRVRDAAGWPVSRETVPARLLHDAESHAWLFNQLARASWCTGCLAAPALDAAGFCAWCGVAPIGRDLGPYARHVRSVV